MVDLPGFLAHDGQLVLAQQGIDLVNASGRGVLYRQHSKIDITRQQRAHGRAEGAVAGQVAPQPAAGDVFLRGGLAVGVRGALESHPDPPACLLVQHPGLLRHRVADQLAEDPAHKAGGHAEIRGHGLHACQHPALAVGVLDQGGTLLLYLGDGSDDAAAPRDEAHDPAVHLIQALPQAGDVLLLLAHAARFPVRLCSLYQGFYHRRTCRRRHGRNLRQPLAHRGHAERCRDPARHRVPCTGPDGKDARDHCVMNRLTQILGFVHLVTRAVIDSPSIEPGSSIPLQSSWLRRWLRRPI